GRGGPAHLKGQRITAELLPLLGVRPLAGRAFLAEEFDPGRDQVALISHRLWQSRFSADPQLIGQAVTLDQQRFTVVGVTPPPFHSFPAADLLTPLTLRAGVSLNENPSLAGVVARLKPGMALGEAKQAAVMVVRSLKGPRQALIQQQMRKGVEQGEGEI